MGDESKWEGLEFYRCRTCHRVVNVWDLKKHNACPYCGGAHFQYTNLTMWEKVKEVVKHPKFWEWKHVKTS